MLIFIRRWQSLDSKIGCRATVLSKFINYEWSVRCSLPHLPCTAEKIITLRHHSDLRNTKYSTFHLV